MTLCLGIVEDNLKRIHVFKNYAATDSPFMLERCEIYCGGSVLASGILYLARAEELPETILIQEETAMICIGMPPDYYKSKPLYLLVLDEPENLTKLANEINRIFFEYNTLEQRLQESVIKGHTIQYLVEQFAPYLNSNELSVVSSEFTGIGCSKNPSHLHAISCLSQPGNDGKIAPDIVTFFKNDAIYNNIRNNTEPFIYEASIYSCRAICINLFHHGEYTCRIVISEDCNPFRGYEAGLLRFFASFIQLVYDLSKEGDDIFPRDYLATLLAKLVDGKSVERQRLENSLSQHKWSLSGPFLCASILPSDRDYYNRTITYYCQVFSRDIKSCSFFEYENSMICVVNLLEYNCCADNFISANIETFRDGNFRIGYSNIFTDLSSLRYYFLQAQIAIDTGLKNTPSRWFHRFSDMVLNYIEAKLTEDMDGRFLCAQEILKLRSYDAKNQTDYLHTLKTYLENQMNAVKTAQRLYIHRNTMEYRLRKIKELAGIDLNNFDQIIYLYLSVRFLL